MTAPNTTRGLRVIKQNIIVNTTTAAAGGTPAATSQDQFEYIGTFICNGSSAVTVVEPNITADSAVIITLKTVGGTVGAIPAIQTITPGTGFTVAGTALDTSTYNYRVIG